MTTRVHPLTEPLEQAILRKRKTGEAGRAHSRILASGAGWRVVDVICTSGPEDRPFEERYWSVAISLVLSGAFVYRGEHGTVLMSKGSFLLGNAGRSYECSHRHGEGDRCLSFQFAPDVFEDLVRDAGARGPGFRCDRVPPLRQTSQAAARAIAAMETRDSFEEIALEVAGCVIRVSTEVGNEGRTTARDSAKIADAIRYLNEHAGSPCPIVNVSQAAGLSPYHFLRAFKSATGVTPHQWLMRARLREAARRLAQDRVLITELALEAGFDDLSNFLRSFRAEFGMSPGRYRAAAQSGPAISDLGRSPARDGLRRSLSREPA